jgi:hypothetical protein
MRYDADGERWDVYLSEEAPRHGARSVIFHCTSNSSFGWRVAEVPADEFPSPERLGELDDDQLGALYRASQPFDYSHDPAAREDQVASPGIRSPAPPGPETGRQ